MIFVGVDIGSCAVKAVAIKKTNKGFNILQTHFFSIKADEKEEQKAILKLGHLKSLADLYNSRETRYIFCFPQNQVSTETLTFPFKEKYKIIKSLPFELEDKLSLFDYKTLISDIKINDFSEGKRQVLVFSAFKESISNLLNELQSIGIKPFMLTCEASAISNLFEIKKTNKKNNPTEEVKEKETEDYHLYLKIGHTHSMAIIFARNSMQNVFSFEWGVFSCIRKIAVKYEIPFNKAMEQFREKAFVLTQTKGYTGSQIEFAKTITEPFGHLVDKLRLLLLQIEGEKKAKCKKIFIYGGGAQVRNLQALLSTQLNTPVVRVEHPPHFPKWNLRNNDEKQNNLITALGTAMAGLKKTKSPSINFLKEEFAIQFDSLSSLWNQWKQPIVFGLISCFLLFTYASLRDTQSKTLSEKMNTVFQKQSTKMIKFKGKRINTQMVQRFIDNKKMMTQKTKLIKQISNIPSVLDQIRELSTAIKKQDSWNLKIQKLNIKNNKIEMEGYIHPKHLTDLEKNIINLAVSGSFKNLIKKNKPENLSEDLENKKILFKYSFTKKQS